MQHQPIGPRDAEAAQRERAVIEELLRDDHDKLWFCSELGRELVGFGSAEFDDALISLKSDGVICMAAGLVCASRCVLHLYALGMLVR